MCRPAHAPDRGPPGRTCHSLGGRPRQWVVSVPVPLLNAHTLCSRLSLHLVLAIPSLNQLLAQPPPALPRVPEGCISPHSRPASRCPLGDSSHGPIVSPSVGQSGSERLAGVCCPSPHASMPGSARHPAACCCRQGARPAAGRGVGEASVASPTPRVHSRRDCGKIAFEIPIGDVLMKINAEVVKILGGAELKERLGAQGIELVTNTPAEFARFIREDNAKMGQDDQGSRNQRRLSVASNCFATFQ